MAGLLSGLDKLGLGKLEGMDLFEEQSTNESLTLTEQDSKPQFNEEEVLFFWKILISYHLLNLLI